MDQEKSAASPPPRCLAQPLLVVVRPSGLIVLHYPESIEDVIDCCADAEMALLRLEQLAEENA